MTDDKYDSVNKLIEVFQRFGKADWRKKTMWGVKASEIRVMLCIKENNLLDANGTTVSFISKKLQVTSPTVTQMINSLLAGDFVIRTNDSKDRRIAYITLTEKGEKFAQKFADFYHAYFKGLIDHLGQEQSETLILLLDQVFQYSQLQNNKAFEKQ